MTTRETRRDQHDQPATGTNQDGEARLRCTVPGDDQLALVVSSYDDAPVQHLVDALFDDQVARYGYADPVEADPATYRAPNGLFLVGLLDAEPVTCGGYRPAPQPQFEPRTVEIKKMFTVATHRGRGLGRRVLAALLEHAAASGARSVVLETGIRNEAALHLYRSYGFEPIPSYVAERDPRINRAFRRNLPLGKA